MADGHPHLPAKIRPVRAAVDAAEALAGAMVRVQDYVHTMQHCYVSEDIWWQGFARLFMELDRQLCNPIALEIAVDQLLARQGSTSWSVQRSRMAL